MPFRDYQADLATGKLDGLFLGGVASSLADPGAFLEPLFGADVQLDRRRPDAEGRARDRGRGRHGGPRRARRRRSAAPTTPSATPRPSSRWPTRARSPRSGPT